MLLSALIGAVFPCVNRSLHTYVLTLGNCSGDHQHPSRLNDTALATITSHLLLGRLCEESGVFPMSGG